jgi:hypothetical protein
MRGHGAQAGGRSRVVVAAVLLCLAAPAVAEPCAALMVKHKLDAAERQIDRQSPAQATASVRIDRGIRTGGNCDDTGWLLIEIRGANDDRTPPAKLGYRIALVGGTLPAHLLLPSDALHPFVPTGDRSGELFQLKLAWVDPATGNQAPIDFTVTITAVDLAGNESAPSLPVRVRHPGGTPVQKN